MVDAFGNKLISPSTNPTAANAIDIVIIAGAALVAIGPARLAISIAMARAFIRILSAIALGIITDALGKRLITPRITIKIAITPDIMRRLFFTLSLILTPSRILNANANAFIKILSAIAFGIIVEAFGNKLITPSTKPNIAIDADIMRRLFFTLSLILTPSMILRAKARAFTNIPKAIALGIITDALGKRLITPRITIKIAITPAIVKRESCTVLLIFAPSRILRAEASVFIRIPKAIALGTITDAFGNTLITPRTTIKIAITPDIIKRESFTVLLILTLSKIRDAVAIRFNKIPRATALEIDD